MSEPNKRKKKYYPEARRRYYLKVKDTEEFKRKRREYSRKRYAENRERYLEYARKWQEANEDKVMEHRHRASMKKRIKGSPLEKECPRCGKKFVVLPGAPGLSVKYCSDECKYEGVKERARLRYYSHEDEIKARAKKWREENRERYNYLKRMNRLKHKLASLNEEASL